MRNLITLLFFVTSIAFGQFSSNQSQYLQFRNLATNPGGEQGLASWTASGGTLTRATAQVRSGSASIGWDASASSQTLSNALVTVPAGNGACLAEFFYYGFGTADIRIYIKDNSANVIGGYTASDTSWAITNAATAWTRVQVPFACPASGTTVQLVLEAQGNAAVGYIDDFYLGRDFRVGSVSTAELVVYAGVSGTQSVASAAETVVVFNSETTDLYSEWNTSTGTFTAKRAGTYLISANVVGNNLTGDEQLSGDILKNGATVSCEVWDHSSAGSSNWAVRFTSCPVTLAAGDTLQLRVESNADTAYDIVDISSSVDGDNWISIVRLPTSSESVMRGDTSDLAGWLKYAATASCQFQTSSASFASFSADTDCPTASVTGNMTAPGTKLAAAIAPKLLPGKYLVIAQGLFFNQASTSGTGICGYQIYDGTTEGAKTAVFENASAGRGSSTTVSGVFEYSSLQTNKQFEVRGRLIAGNQSSCDIDVINADLEIRIIPLSQSLPRPFIPSSVFAGRQSVVKVGSAVINCAASSSITENPDSMVASVGNVSAGACTVTLTTGYFSATPSCSITPIGTLSTNPASLIYTRTSATSISIDSVVNGAAGTDYNFSLQCMGAN